MEAVILDMDGVLVDSEGLQLQAANTVLGRFGVRISEEENVRYLGMDDPAFFAALKETHGFDASIEELIAARTGEMLELIGKGVLPRPGVPELIVGLKMRGYPLALASSSPRAVVDAMLEELGLAGSLDVVVTGDDVDRGKPEPDIFLLAARRLGVEPAECLVFEDSLHGVRAARAAGMTPVAVRTRENHNIEFREAARVYDGFERFDWAFLDDR
jgi:HAD superfamily hydrolase (TIGR01509 family)